MKILTGKDIREADLYTIEHEPVAGIELMERAALALEAEIAAAAETTEDQKTAAEAPEYLIIAGKGNNGGDGLAVARLLKGCFGDTRSISVILLAAPDQLSPDCRLNLNRLPAGISLFGLDCGHITADGSEFPPEQLFRRNTVVIDAILGTGVTGAVRGAALQAIRLVNEHSRRCRMVISIDMPSGLPTEPRNREEAAGADVIAADLTLTIEFPKLSLLLPETGRYAGRLRTVHIGLDRRFMDSRESAYAAVDTAYVPTLLQPRGEFDHKGTHGHALVIAGSAEYLGAAILCTGAALRSGCGLVSVHIPAAGRSAMLISHPAAIISADEAPVFSSHPADLGKYSAVAVGPGIGRSEAAAAALEKLLACLPQHPRIRTTVLDADALNIISERPEMMSMIPEGSVLTPHVGELSRLLRAAGSRGLLEDVAPAGAPWRDDLHKVALVRQLCARLKSVIVLKGAHTMVCSPDGRCFFNMSGNPGMAKGGSGDVLTGLVAGLAARGYDSLSAAILGVWFHGLAGDAAASLRGMEAMNAEDILENIRI